MKEKKMAANASADEKRKKFYKIVILGGGGVGKSCLTFRLVHDSFLDKYDPTIEDSYRKENFQVDGEHCPIEIMDTAGQDTYASMRNVYYKNGDGFLLVYSITDSSSLEDVKERFQSLLTQRGVDPATCPPVILVGNKCDLESNRVVSIDQGQNLAVSMGPNVGHMETSAKTNINVSELFQEMVRRIKTNDEIREKEERKRKKKGCVIF